MDNLIKKSKSQKSVANLQDYATTYRNFSWDQIASELDGLPEGRGLNIAYEAIDRHLKTPQQARKVALRWCSKADVVKDYTYKDLAVQSNQFANALQSLGIGPGDVVFGLLQRIPELYMSFFGTLKNRSVFSPLFAAFGPEPIKARMTLGQGKVLVTTERLFRKKVAGILDELPALQHVIIVDLQDESLKTDKRLLAYQELMETQSTDFEIGPTEPESPSLLHFTSGTTGLPKGAIHVHQAVVSHYVTGKLALDLHPDDIYWCTADPGWVTGTSYGIISPLVNGVTMIIDEGEFDAERWYQLIQKHQVNVWYTAPTAIRMMMRQGEDLVHQYDTSSLRYIASVGEPLNPEAIRWGLKAFKLPIHDNWWQTETGGIMVANFASMDIKPGSMGKPLPGIQVRIAKRHDQGLTDCAAGEEGELAIKTPWPSMFRGYLNQEERYRSSFVDNWYLTGDLASRDDDDYYWFVGRADDVIKSAGHLIGPFEVESALIEHPAVAEAAVIGKPDSVLLEVVKAFVTLNPQFSGSQDEIKQQIMAHARKRLGPAVAPRELAIVDDLPRTRSGKIMRRLLKARELGLPEGDLSTLENQPNPKTSEAPS